MPKVTVVIATYGWPEVLPYSIGSVLAQTFTDFELLVIGDGCADETEDVVRPFTLADDRVRWINLPENTRHQTGPNNEAIRVARGTHLAYLGHDDLWLPNHLDVVLGALPVPDGASHSLAAGIGVDIPLFLCPGNPMPFGTWQWIPPSVTLQPVAALRAVGGWKTPQELVTEIPEVSVNKRLEAAGVLTRVALRLTALKLPANARPNVYAERPSHEQAYWAEQIATRPNLEAELLGEIMSHRRVPDWPGLPAPSLRRGAAEFWAALQNRARRRPPVAHGNQPGWHEVARKKKGLD